MHINRKLELILFWNMNLIFSNLIQLYIEVDLCACINMTYK